MNKTFYFVTGVIATLLIVSLFSFVSASWWPPWGSSDTRLGPGPTDAAAPDNANECRRDGVCETKNILVSGDPGSSSRIIVSGGGYVPDILLQQGQITGTQYNIMENAAANISSVRGSLWYRTAPNFVEAIVLSGMYAEPIVFSPGRSGDVMTIYPHDIDKCAGL